MTVTVTKVQQEDVGLGERIVADVAFDAVYAHSHGAGEIITAALLGFRVGLKIDSLEAAPVDGHQVEFRPSATLPHQGQLRVLGELGDDFTLNRPVLALGTVSAKEVKVTNPITKVVGGAIAEVAAAEVAFTVTTHDITADADKIQEAIFLLSVQAGGTLILTKGATADEDVGVPPALPAGEAPVGTAKVKVAAGATDFDATTDDLDAAHLTTTFQDMDGEVLQGTDLSGLTVRVVATGR